MSIEDPFRSGEVSPEDVNAALESLRQTYFHPLDSNSDSEAWREAWRAAVAYYKTQGVDALDGAPRNFEKVLESKGVKVEEGY